MEKSLKVPLLHHSTSCNAGLGTETVTRLSASKVNDALVLPHRQQHQGDAGGEEGGGLFTGVRLQLYEQCMPYDSAKIRYSRLRPRSQYPTD